MSECQYCGGSGMQSECDARGHPNSQYRADLLRHSLIWLEEQRDEEQRRRDTYSQAHNKWLRHHDQYCDLCDLIGRIEAEIGGVS